MDFVELEALKERFVKHAFHTAQPKTERTVSLNIIRKEMTNDGKEELKADVVPVTLATEMVEDATRTKPGMLSTDSRFNVKDWFSWYQDA